MGIYALRDSVMTFARRECVDARKREHAKQQRLTEKDQSDGLDALTNDFALQRTVFFAIGDGFTDKCDNPPTITIPFWRNERGVESSMTAKSKRPR